MMLSELDLITLVFKLVRVLWVDFSLSKRFPGVYR